jgi:aryl-alcohol dehydrogenase-like predicted oxidoreductase
VSTGWEDANEAIDAAVAAAPSEIAKRHAATSTQIALAWQLRRSRRCCRFPAPFHSAPEENLAALEIELTDAEFDAVR